MAHGYSHRFRADKPLLAPTSADGALALHWVEVTVDPRDPDVFRSQAHVVDAKRFPCCTPRPGRSGGAAGAACKADVDLRDVQQSF